jgi:RNA polymerase sigma-70 factor (ECF subfamily)
VPDLDEELEARWIREAKAGDRPSLEQLLLVHYEDLTSFLTQRLREAKPGMLSVEDLVQQTMMQVFRDIKRLEARPGINFSAWLKAIANHRILDEIRNKRRQKRGGEWQRRWGIETDSGNVLNPIDAAPATDNSPSRSASRHEKWQKLIELMQQLEPDQRQAIRLRFLEGLSIEEIAVAMDKTTGSIRGLLHRGKAALRTLLGSASQWLSSR